jgi:hypothetical protein
MSNTDKPYDHDYPFHRIESPSYNRRGQADGRGYQRGCHSPKHGPEVFWDGPFDAIAGDLMRGVPGWVAVEGEEVEEVEGRLDRSFQTWTDFPVRQWHIWYDWNFHVDPVDGYEFLRGRGNEPHGETSTPAGKRRVVLGETMECEWDCGAFGRRPGMMFGGQVPWPMSNYYVWLLGRWIYDCGHATSDEVSGADEGLMRSEIHPCKAMATAWWEAEKFDENGDLYVPAIKFLFFTSRRGGYVDFPAINDVDRNGNDFKFIVDLPKLTRTSAAQSAVGPSETTAANTLVSRGPRLLHKFDFQPFQAAAGTKGRIDPIIEPIPLDDPEKPPEQVKITIPVTQLPDCDAYGVIVSLGWYDPDKTEARKVKQCTVIFRELFKGHEDHDTFAEEWLLKAGVNHRWFQWQFSGMRNGTRHSLNDVRARFWLQEDEHIIISSHGAELDGTHDSMGIGPLQVGGTTAHWRGDIDSWRPELGTADNRDRADNVQARRVIDALTSLLPISASDTNEPLGLIDANRGPAAERSSNPLAIKTPDVIDRNITLTAFPASEVGDSAELVEAIRGTNDYRLTLRIQVEPQAIP